MITCSRARAGRYTTMLMKKMRVAEAREAVSNFT